GGYVGVLRRLAALGLDLDADLRGFADRIFLLVGLDLDAELMAFPADLDPRDAHAVGGFGEVDQGGRRRAFAILDLEAGRALQLAEPASAAGDAPAHRHHRDIDVGSIGRGQLDLDDGVGALQRHDEARQDALALDGDERGRFAERHADLEFRGVARAVARLFGDHVHAVAIVAAEP